MEAHHASTSASVVQLEAPQLEGAAPQQAAGPSQSGVPPEHLVLHLVPQKKKKKKKQAVQWAEDVVDNELLDKKKSKKCCIFHRQRPFGEWSDEEDGDSECEECDRSGEAPTQ